MKDWTIKRLENRISNMNSIDNELDTLLYKIGDSPEDASEDELMNIVIGVQALQKARQEDLNLAFKLVFSEETS